VLFQGRLFLLTQEKEGLVGYLNLGRNNLVWGAVERGVREGATAEKIVADIAAINKLSKGHWRTLIRRLGKADPEQIPTELRDKLIELAKQHL